MLYRIQSSFSTITGEYRNTGFQVHITTPALATIRMAQIKFSFENRRYQHRWFLIFFALLTLLESKAAAQAYVGISLNSGSRQYYAPSYGFEEALAPSGSISISRNESINENWFFRYGALAGVVGYKLNVVMIDTLGPNGDVSSFPEYTTFFASAEFLLGHSLHEDPSPLSTLESMICST